jgi:predicted TIM-barrel fold metal-dependent hydrolase
VGVLFAVVVAAASAEESKLLPAAPWRADHHMHLRSRSLYDAWIALCDALEQRSCERPDPQRMVVTGSDAVAALDRVAARRGVVLSSAYQFGSPYVASKHYDVADMTRAENEYVATEVGRFPARLVGFFSVDPLDGSAASEVAHWAADGRLKGLKLHLANSAVNFHDTEQVAKVAAIVRLAAQKKLPMVIHVRTGVAFGADESEIFIRDVLPAAGSSWVQIAHVGGWGGYDSATAAELRMWADCISRGDAATRRVLFDLAYVVSSSMTADEASDLVAQMRRIGIRRFVLGSDFDSDSPSAADDKMRTKLPLTDSEWRSIAERCAPWAC